MKYFLPIVLSFVVVTSAYSQNDSGIFLSTPCAKRSPRQTVRLTNKQVCLASNPMIVVSEFTSITEVLVQGDNISFDLTLSPKAIQTLMQLSSSLPNSTFALVVDKDVFFVFPASELSVGRTFRFQATGKDKSAFFVMHKKLKDIVDSKTP